MFDIRIYQLNQLLRAWENDCHVTVNTISTTDQLERDYDISQQTTDQIESELLIDPSITMLPTDQANASPATDTVLHIDQHTTLLPTNLTDASPSTDTVLPVDQHTTLLPTNLTDASPSTDTVLPVDQHTTLLPTSPTDASTDVALPIHHPTTLLSPNALPKTVPPFNQPKILLTDHTSGIKLPPTINGRGRPKGSDLTHYTVDTNINNKWCIQITV